MANVKERATARRTSAAGTGGRGQTAREPKTADPKRDDGIGKTGAAAEAGEHDGGGFTLNLPVASIHIQGKRPHMPSLPHIDRREIGHAVNVTRSFLPPPERLLYYGGLGALAVLGAIEWPVAAAIGVGTMVAQRAIRKEAGPDTSPSAGDGGRSEKRRSTTAARAGRARTT
ncbi:hypothetical protein [Thermostaphylospora chromogena]|uniref:Uncharacterized protein n=1 Tax=Thermostaphylospora chromogena TaxID=35622 RepID=A0A1H1CM23_9ACTN|nr:hypothetical protein [Thermostaphylospora chromogena]SDQ65098.1 hypothetical protein SAMN04489764_1539 [Thermostaphylospora chromogena]